MQPFEERIEIRDRAAIMTGLRRGEMVPPCSAASRCSAALRPCGRLRRPGPGLRAAVGWPLSSAAGPPSVKRQAGADVAEIVRDVLGADGLLGEAALEGAAQRRIAVRLQQRVQPLDIANPDLRAPMGELGEIGQGGGAEIEQMLPLQIAPRALARDRGDALGAMLGQDRAVAGLRIAAHGRH